MKSPIVSVIIPCYNASRFLPDTIKSVLSQSFEDFELLIIDDGSTDNTPEVVAQFLDERIIYIRKENTGVADTRNRGIALARGKYVAFLDSDDMWMKDNLLKKVQILELGQHLAVFSDGIERDFSTGSERYLHGCDKNVRRRLLELVDKTLPCLPSNIVLSKKDAESIGGFDINLSTSADWDFGVRLASVAAFAHIPEPLFIYRAHPSQMHKNIPLFEKDMLYAFRKARKSRYFDNDSHYRECLSRLYLILAGSYFRYKNAYFKVARYLTLSFLLHPPHLIQKVVGKVWGGARNSPIVKVGGS